MDSTRITIILGTAAKGSGAVIQLAIWPIMAVALGSPEFQLFAVIWGATNWLSQTALGLPVGLSQTLLAARAGNHDISQTKISGFQLFAGFTTIALFLVFAIISAAKFFGLSIINPGYEQKTDLLL